MKFQHKREDNLKKHCKEAIKFFKKTYSNKNKKHKLIELPAYLLIGTSKSGKTTFLEKSDLKFILEKINKTKKEEMNTYDWWVTSRAVIIDTPSSYFASSKSKRQDSYIPFLKILRRNSYKKQIKGIIVILSLSDIIYQNDYVKSFYENIKNQLIDISKFIGRQIPIFLVVNKCDLVSGFCEFFSELSREERYQVWGFTFEKTNKEKEKLSIKFDKEFNRLINRLNDQLIFKLQYEKDINNRILINNFPFQISQLKPYLLCLLGQVFDTPKINLSGVFFASCVQQPDVSYETSYKSFSYSSALMNVKPFQNRAFFIHDFLNNFIYSTSSEKVGRKININLFIKIMASVFSISLIVMFAIALSSDFKRQLKTVTQAQKAVSLYQAFAQTGMKTHSMSAQLESLNALNAAFEVLRDKKSSNMSFLMIENHKILQGLQQKVFLAYQKALQEFLLPTILNQLTNVLYNGKDNYDLLYETLRSYLMIDDRSKFNVNDVSANIQKILQNKYSKEEILKISNHIAELFNSKFVVEVDQKAIDTARNRLKKLDTIELVSVILKSYIPLNQKLSLNLAINQDAASMFTFAKLNNDIWSVYTAENFTYIYPNLIKKASIEAILGNRVIGEIEEDSAEAQQKVDVLINQVSSQYIENYAKVWLDFLNNVKIIHFTQLDELNKVIKLLQERESPLVQLINLVQSNLVVPVTEIDEELKSFASLSHHKAFKKTATEDITNLLQNLYSYLSPIYSASDQKQKIFELTSLRLRNKGKNDALSDLFSRVNTYPEPIKSWLYDIGMNIWQLMCYQSEEYINEIWSKDIVPQYQAQIEGLFPFSAVASNEVSLESFAYFFAPNGIIDNFYNNYLSTFIDSTQMPWKLKNLDGGGLRLSNETIKFFEKAYQIQHIYFKPSSQNPYLTFAMRPKRIEKNIDRVSLSLGAQQIDYLSNRSLFEEEFIWPDYINSNRIEIVFVGKNGEREYIKDKGAWALLKLLQKSGLHLIEGKSYYVAEFNKGQYSMKVDISTKIKENPFSLERFTELGFPREII